MYTARQENEAFSVDHNCVVNIDRNPKFARPFRLSTVAYICNKVVVKDLTTSESAAMHYSVKY